MMTAPTAATGMAILPADRIVLATGIAGPGIAATVPGALALAAAGVSVEGVFTGVVVGGVAFLMMEPVTAAVHRFVMHGFGWRLHASHHQARGGGGFELNDLYPLMFASATMVVMAAGFQRRGLGVLVPATVGITVYGACYGFVHEVYIHRRISFGWRVAALDRLRDAHLVHHARSDGPYGMLVPMVPARLRARALTRG